MAIKLRKWDSAEHLKTEEDMQAYLQACIDESDPRQYRGQQIPLNS